MLASLRSEKLEKWPCTDTPPFFNSEGVSGAIQPIRQSVLEEETSRLRSIHTAGLLPGSWLADTVNAAYYISEKCDIYFRQKEAGL